MANNRKGKQEQEQAIVQEQEQETEQQEQASEQQEQEQETEQQEQASEQQEQEQETAIEIVKDSADDTIVSAVLSAVPSLKDDDGKAREVHVGQAVIKNEVTAKTIVTTRTIYQFSRISSVMGAIEMGAIDKEKAKAEGFTSVYRMFENALPSLSDARIRELYTVGRIFGDITTHKWKSPIPEKADVTKLSCIAKKLKLGSKIDEATPEDIATRFNLFCDKCLHRANPINLEDTLTEVRKAIDAILKDDSAIPTTATPIDGQQANGQQADGQQASGQQEQANVQEQASGQQEQEQASVREALNLLYEYFRGNEKAQEYIALIQAELPVIQEQEQEESEQQEQEQEQEESEQ